MYRNTWTFLFLGLFGCTNMY
uniref:Uncharacterized protein n=1 Tax=Rhizophora mucronata TaxID=61149 RepID=A0A2P2LQV5_RHIMU